MIKNKYLLILIFTIIVSPIFGFDCEDLSESQCKSNSNCHYYPFVSCCGNSKFFCVNNKSTGCSSTQLTCGLNNKTGEIFEFWSQCKPTKDFVDYHPSKYTSCSQLDCESSGLLCKWIEPKCHGTSCCANYPACVDKNGNEVDVSNNNNKYYYNDANDNQNQNQQQNQTEKPFVDENEPFDCETLNDNQEKCQFLYPNCKWLTFTGCCGKQVSICANDPKNHCYDNDLSCVVQDKTNEIYEVWSICKPSAKSGFKKYSPSNATSCSQLDCESKGMGCDWVQSTKCLGTSCCQRHPQCIPLPGNSQQSSSGTSSGTSSSGSSTASLSNSSGCSSNSTGSTDTSNSSGNSGDSSNSLNSSSNNSSSSSNSSSNSSSSSSSNSSSSSSNSSNSSDSSISSNSSSSSDNSSISPNSSNSSDDQSSSSNIDNSSNSSNSSNSDSSSSNNSSSQSNSGSSHSSQDSNNSSSEEHHHPHHHHHHDHNETNSNDSTSNNPTHSNTNHPNNIQQDENNSQSFEIHDHTVVPTDISSNSINSFDPSKGFPVTTASTTSVVSPTIGDLTSAIGQITTSFEKKSLSTSGGAGESHHSFSQTSTTTDARSFSTYSSSFSSSSVSSSSSSSSMSSSSSSVSSSSSSVSSSSSTTLSSATVPKPPSFASLQYNQVNQLRDDDGNYDAIRNNVFDDDDLWNNDMDWYRKPDQFKANENDIQDNNDQF